MTENHTPPAVHDDPAEQSVLGALLTYPDTIEPVTERLTTADFYRPIHQTIYATITANWASNQPTDPVSLAAQLVTDRTLIQAGGLSYLHTLMSRARTPGNATYHADLVAAASHRRQLVLTATRIMQLANIQDQDPADLARAATRLLDETTATITAPAINGNRWRGRIRLTPASTFQIRPITWTWQDRIPLGEITLVAGREGVGKALAVDTPILTDRGWLTMADVKPGDQVRHPTGGWTTVAAATPTMTGRPCYQITFDDDTRIVADADHLWRTETLNAREHRNGETPAVVTTRHIAETLRARDGHCLNHAIPTTAPLDGHHTDLPIDPYVLGAWLGDGHSQAARITCADPEIIDRIRQTGTNCHKSAAGQYLYRLGDGQRPGRNVDRQAAGFTGRLRALAVYGNKHIPTAYLNAPIGDRLALLQGLMDTDGTIRPDGRAELSVCHQPLADTAHQLLLSLGIKVALRSGPAKLYGRTVNTRWRLSFRTDLPVFHLPRKAAHLKPATTRRHQLRYITAADPIPPVPVRCIQVTHPDGMYLAGQNLIPTHNSTFLAWLAAAVTNGNLPGHHHNQPRAVLYAATEDSWEATIAPRMLAAGANLDLIYRVDTTDPDDHQLVLPKDTVHLPYLATDTGAAVLMCDPIVSLIDDEISPNRPKDLRRALEPLRVACDQAHIACIALAHFNKSSADDIGTLIAGSRAWAEVPRAILGTVQDRDADDYTCVLSQIKNNLGRLDHPHLQYTIATVELETDHGQPTYVGRLVWTGEAEHSAEDLLIGNRGHGGGGNRRPPTERALRVVQHVRDHGHPITSAEIQAAFEGDIPGATVRSILARSLRNGDLVQPVRGTYTAPRTR